MPYFFNKKQDRIYLYYRRRRIVNFLKLYIKLYFLFIFIAYVLESNFYAVYKIRNSNMEPSLKKDTWVLVEKIDGEDLASIEEFTREFKRGDIVTVNKAEEGSWLISVLDLPVYLASLGFFKLNKDRIVFGRILALPNERIAIRDKTIYINEEVFIPNWLIQYEDFRILDENVLQRDNLSQIFIPSDKVFLINDNWEIFNDSRALGLESTDNLKGIYLRDLMD